MGPAQVRNFTAAAARPTFIMWRLFKARHAQSLLMLTLLLKFTSREHAQLYLDDVSEKVAKSRH